MGTATTTRKAEATRPVREFRLGRIKAVVWANDTDKGVRHNVTLRRIYLDSENKWQSTDSFGREDLLLVAKVADLAHSWIFETAASDASSREEGDRDGEF